MAARGTPSSRGSDLSYNDDATCGSDYSGSDATTVDSSYGSENSNDNDGGGKVPSTCVKYSPVAVRMKRSQHQVPA
ncbi:hypothetical protein RRG08_063159 [Elysia crispata]|uniref:Uncharacterized protein n=1 Tax=Elysia crispata TaxID=231223 RepID=A0AAE1D5H4_9GAST|nr:hypothetical protein RRG08_063159 [Elysia crispata]